MGCLSCFGSAWIIDHFFFLFPDVAVLRVSGVDQRPHRTADPDAADRQPRGLRQEVRLQQEGWTPPLPGNSRRDSSQRKRRADPKRGMSSTTGPVFI